MSTSCLNLRERAFSDLGTGYHGYDLSRYTGDDACDIAYNDVKILQMATVECHCQLIELYLDVRVQFIAIIHTQTALRLSPSNIEMVFDKRFERNHP